jgi:hypothetical protein
MKDAVEHGVAQVDVAGRHVDPGAQHPRAIGELARAHAAEQVEVLLHGAIAERAVAAGLRQGAAAGAHVVLGLIVHIGLAGADQVLRPGVELFEIVRRVVEMFAPIEAEPMDVLLDGVDEFLLFLGRVGVVEAQIALAAEFLGDAEVQADRFGVADMEIAVRLRRKPGDDLAGAAVRKIGLDDVANEVATRFYGFGCGHCG